jgi:hypothetical protein
LNPFVVQYCIRACYQRLTKESKVNGILQVTNHEVVRIGKPFLQLIVHTRNYDCKLQYQKS